MKQNMFCRLTEDEDPPFSFKNRQQMTQNITEFRVSLVSVVVANLSCSLYTAVQLQLQEAQLPQR